MILNPQGDLSPANMIELLTEIPNLELDSRYPSPYRERGGAVSPILSVSSTGADTSGPSSRRTSISSSGRPASASGRSGSATSSRSTSFNLPSEARKEIRSDSREPGEEVEFEEEEMDEEGEYRMVTSHSSP